MQQSRYLSKTVDIKEISYSFTKKIVFATNKKQIYRKNNKKGWIWCNCCNLRIEVTKKLYRRVDTPQTPPIAPERSIIGNQHPNTCRASLKFCFNAPTKSRVAANHHKSIEKKQRRKTIITSRLLLAPQFVGTMMNIISSL